MLQNYIKLLLSFEWLPYLGVKIRQVRLFDEARKAEQDLVLAEQQQKKEDAAIKRKGELNWFKRAAGIEDSDKQDAKVNQEYERLLDDVHRKSRNPYRSPFAVRVDPGVPRFNSVNESIPVRKPRDIGKPQAFKPEDPRHDIEAIVESTPDKKIPEFGEDPMALLAPPAPPIARHWKPTMAQVSTAVNQWEFRVRTIGDNVNWNVDSLSGIELEDIFLNMLGTITDCLVQTKNDKDPSLVFVIESPRRIQACLDEQCDSSNSLTVTVDPKSSYWPRGVLNTENAFRIARWFDCKLEPVPDEKWKATFTLEPTCCQESKNPAEAVLKALIRARVFELESLKRQESQKELSSQPPAYELADSLFERPVPNPQ